jgi:signal transduction histidine kinase
VNTLKRLLPRRLAHQLGLLLVLALAASHAIAILFLQRSGALVHPLSRTLVLERLSTAYHAVDGLDGDQAQRLLQAMSSAESRFWVDPTAEVAPFAMHDEEQRLAADLAERLEVPGANITLQLERIGGGPARNGVLSPAGWEPLRLRSSIVLPSGLRLNALQHPAGAYEWGHLLAYALPVSTVPILLILLFFMGRVVRPFRTLATAAERISRGEWVASQRLRGPREAQELSAAFNLMQERLARHIEGRTQMLASLSHDLNTPLTELRLQLELLDDDALRADLLESLDELRTMVSQTLGFLRDEAVQEGMGRLSLTALLDELARRYRLMGQPVTWAYDEGLYCYARPVALKRALTNLIDNALRHGGGAQVLLRREQQQLCLEIVDHGPGIDPSQLELVFQPFVRLTNSEGTGLGLTIARSCIQAHGGELRLYNRSPAGLCAQVLLPAAAGLASEVQRSA